MKRTRLLNLKDMFRQLLCHRQFTDGIIVHHCNSIRKLTMAQELPKHVFKFKSLVLFIRIFRIITPMVGFLLYLKSLHPQFKLIKRRTAHVKQYFHETNAMKPCRMKHNLRCLKCFFFKSGKNNSSAYQILRKIVSKLYV